LTMMNEEDAAILAYATEEDEEEQPETECQLCCLSNIHVNAGSSCWRCNYRLCDSCLNSVLQSETPNCPHCRRDLGGRHGVWEGEPPILDRSHLSSQTTINSNASGTSFQLPFPRPILHGISTRRIVYLATTVGNSRAYSFFLLEGDVLTPLTRDVFYRYPDLLPQTSRNVLLVMAEAFLLRL
jgi:hypothetical protein